MRKKYNLFKNIKTLSNHNNGRKVTKAHDKLVIVFKGNC